MSALDGETLTLPSGLASLAGFGTSDNPYSDDTTLAAISASTQQIDETAQQNVLGQPRGTKASVPIATLQNFAPPHPLIIPKDTTQPAPTTSPEMGWREQPGAFDYNPDQPSTSPHPLLNDSRFWQAWRQDPQAAHKMYQGITGRSLESDMSLYAANQKSLQEEDKTQVTEMFKKGLTFHPVTGEPMMEKPLHGAISLPGAPPPTYKAPLEPYEKAALSRSYKNLTGLDLPTGIQTPKFSTPQEAVAFKQVVKEYYDNDKSNDPDAVKIKRASDTVQSKIWNAQTQAASIATNSAATNANPPDAIANFLAKTINLFGHSATQGANIINAGLNAPTRMVGSSPFPYARAPQVTTADVSNNPAYRAWNALGSGALDIAKRGYNWATSEASDPANWGQ